MTPFAVSRYPNAGLSTPEFACAGLVVLIILLSIGAVLHHRKERSRRHTRYEFDDYGRLRSEVPPPIKDR